MKKLTDYAKMQEMNSNEMKEVNGGLGALTWFIVGYVVNELIDRESIKDAKEGWNAGWNTL